MSKGPVRSDADHPLPTLIPARRLPKPAGPLLTPLLASLLVVACGVALPPEIPVAVEARGTGVVVTCAAPCGGAQREALPFAEEARAVASDLFGDAPERIGRVHLARSVDEYEAIESRAAGGRLRTNLAFAKPEWALGVVAIQPAVDSAVMARTGVPMQTLRLVAHEASHLVSFMVMPAPRRVPGWLEEGLAIHVETEVGTRLGRMDTDLAEDPFFSTYLWRTARAEADGRLPTPEELMADDAGELDAGEVYAARGVLFRGLVETDTDAVRAGLRAAVAAHADGGGEADLTAAFVEAFGGADRVAEAFAAYRGGLRPAWREVARTLETGGTVWTQHAFPRRSAHAVRLDPAGSRWTLSMRVRVSADRRAVVTLHDATDRLALVRITPDEIVLLRHESFEVLGRLPAPTEPDPAGVDLRLTVEGSTVTIRSGFGDLEAVDVGAPLDGPWGLMVEPGGWAEWENVTFVR